MRRLLIVVSAVMLSVACYTYRAEPAPVPGPDRVRVRFNPPEAVNVAVSGRPTLRLTDVTELEGQIMEVRGDMAKLDVRDARVRGGLAPALVRGSSTAVVRLGAGRVTEVRRLDGPRTAAAVLGGGVLGLFALLVALAAQSGIN